VQRRDPEVTPLRRVVLASSVGTAIESYDFLIYGIASALVFPRVFFPGLGAAGATVAALTTFSVAFLVGPLGRAR